MARDTSSPTYQAYTVIKRDGLEDWWQCLGAAFPHSDGQGYNLVLQALPLDGKIVLRPPKNDGDEKNEARGNDRDARSNTHGNRHRTTRR